MAYNIIKYDSSNIRILHDINFGRDLNKNINNDYYTIETVRSELYLRDNSTDITSNLIAEPYIESGERVYPPVRNFVSNNFASIIINTINYNCICTYMSNIILKYMDQIKNNSNLFLN